MTNAELASKQAEIHATANHLSKLIGELVGPTPPGLIANAAFAAQLHLQDGMNRVSNIFIYLAQGTEENVTKTVDDALAGGTNAPKLVVLPGGTPDTKG